MKMKAKQKFVYFIVFLSLQSSVKCSDINDFLKRTVDKINNILESIPKDLTEVSRNISESQTKDQVVKIIPQLVVNATQNAKSSVSVIDTIEKVEKDILNSVGNIQVDFEEILRNPDVEDTAKKIPSEIEDQVKIAGTKITDILSSPNLEDNINEVAHEIGDITKDLIDSIVNSSFDTTNNIEFDVQIDIRKEIENLEEAVEQLDLETNIHLIANEVKRSDFQKALNKLGEEIGKIESIVDIERILNESVLLYNDIKRSVQTQCQTCSGLDMFGNKWEACVGETSKQLCPNSEAPRYAEWKCNETNFPKFFTDQPDYTNCSTKRILDLEKEIGVLTKDEMPHSKAKLLLHSLKSLVEIDNKAEEDSDTVKYFGHEIKTVVSLTTQILSHTANATLNEAEDLTEAAMNIMVTVLVNPNPWKQLLQCHRSEVGTNIIDSVEKAAFNFADKIVNMSNPEYDTYTVLPIPSDQLGFLVSFGVKENMKDENQTVVFPSEAEHYDTYIKLPLHFSTEKEGIDLEFVGMLIESKYVENILTTPANDESALKDKKMNGKLLSYTLHELGKVLQLQDESVEVIFQHDTEAWGETTHTLKRRLHPGEKKKAVMGESVCAFWETEKLRWSTEGCKKIYSKSDNSVTTFQVVLRYLHILDLDNGDTIGEKEIMLQGKDYGLQMLTWILCPISIVCLLITILIFSTIRKIRSDQGMITTHLSISLIAGNLILLVVDRDHLYLSDGICAAAGVVTHYIWLCAFGWMAVQGYHLHSLVIDVFKSRENRLKIYAAFAYGVPLIIVGITSSVGFALEDQFRSVYGGEMFCWLRGHYLWGFMSPVLVVVLCNSVVLSIAIRIACIPHPSKAVVESTASKTSKKHREMKARRKLLQGGISLSVLLGLTWIIGFFTMVDLPGFFFISYLFTILNASQGIFIFIFNCAMNETVRKSSKEYFRFSSITWPSWLSSSGSYGVTSEKRKENKKKTITREDIDSTPQELKEVLLVEPHPEYEPNGQ